MELIEDEIQKLVNMKGITQYQILLGYDDYNELRVMGYILDGEEGVERDGEEGVGHDGEEEVERDGEEGVGA